MDILADLARDLGLTEPPSLRTLRLWRTKRLLTPSDRRVSRKNLLEVLGILQLRAAGLTMTTAAQRCREADEAQLLVLLERPQIAVADKRGDYAQDTLTLLARGIVEQFRLVSQHGAIVGHVGGTPTGHTSTPISFRQAAARLGRLFFEEGREDLAASYHLLLVQCQKPLRDWAPAALWALPSVADTILVDPAYRVPSEECEALSQQVEGSSLEDLIEHRLHAGLSETLSRLGTDKDAAYTSIREFIGRHPMASAQELQSLRANPELTNAAVEFVFDLYRPVHAENARKGLVQRCSFCQALIGPDGRCVLQGCREDHHATQRTTPLPLDQAFVARPEVLKYWADPAREELRLYDELRGAGIEALLYPHTDLCDVAIGEEVGIDVKDYREPVQMARKLNRDRSGLAHYARRFVAIAERRLRTGDYLGRLREQLSRENQRSLVVLGVNEVSARLQKEFGRQKPGARKRARHAAQA